MPFSSKYHESKSVGPKRARSLTNIAVDTSEPYGEDRQLGEGRRDPKPLKTPWRLGNNC